MELKNLNELNTEDLIKEVNSFLDEEYNHEFLVPYNDFVEWYKEKQKFWKDTNIYYERKVHNNDNYKY